MPRRYTPEEPKFTRVIGVTFLGEPDKDYLILKYDSSLLRKDGVHSPPQRTNSPQEFIQRMKYPVPFLIKSESTFFSDATYYWINDREKYKEILNRYPNAIEKGHGTLPEWEKFINEMTKEKFFWHLKFIIFMLICFFLLVRFL